MEINKISTDFFLCFINTGIHVFIGLYCVVILHEILLNWSLLCDNSSWDLA